MAILDITKLKRNRDAILKCFKKVGDSYVITKDTQIIFPTRYLEKNLGSITSSVRVIGIYAILDDEGNYSVSLSPIFQDLTPYNISDVIIGDDEYKVLTYSKNDIFLSSTNLIVSDKFIYDLFDDFYIKGNIPWFLNNEDVAKILVNSKKYTKTNIGNNPLVLEMITSLITRDSNNNKTLYKELVSTNTDKYKNKPEYIGLNNIYYSYTNTGSKLIGGYFKDGIVGSIVDPETKPTIIVDVLRA